jgi:DNA-binding transcriptional ArsR family regulator
MLEPNLTTAHPPAQPIAPPPEEAIGQLADLFHLLGDPTRLRIVLACLVQPTAVGDIASGLMLSSSLVSHHLRLLRAARIVKAERQGKQVFYSAADAHISSLLSTMFEHIAEPANGMDA